MGIKPWRELQPDFLPWLIGIIMSAYCGGRSENKIRRQIRRILACDFRSAYPSTSILLGLWRFVIAKRTTWRNASAEVRGLMERLRVDDLQRQETWARLCILVRVIPGGDLFPVRAPYGEDGQRTIALNYLTSKHPIWFTFLDCIVSWVLTGKWPNVIEAIHFEPAGIQDGLKPWNIFGKPDYQVDPIKDDLHKRLGDLRTEVRELEEQAKQLGDRDLADRLNAEQLAIKITDNAGYGAGVELNVVQPARPVEVVFHDANGEPHRQRVRQFEQPGTFFHPLLATFTTAGARLLLALAERLATDEGIEWSHCDTDSMGLARPLGMSDAEFLERAKRVQDWFTALNPYSKKGAFFRIEETNFRLRDGTLTEELEPLYFWGIAPKRNCLFNLDDQGRPILRKASGHALGYLRAPYGEAHAPRGIPKPVVPLGELGVPRWEYDLWYRIVEAAIDGHPNQVRLDDLPGFDKPAMSRYAATTPALLRWFKNYNRHRPYRDQVRPFGFICAFQAAGDSHKPSQLNDLAAAEPKKWKRKLRDARLNAPRVVSPFDVEPEAAAQRAFDRDTGEPIPVEKLLIYRQVLAQYHLHPDPKFQGADYLDSGITERRHIEASGFEYIGKEANRWEEQFYLGENPEAQIVYGSSTDDRDEELEGVKAALRRYGQRRFAKSARQSREKLRQTLKPTRSVSGREIASLTQSVDRLAENERRRFASQNTLMEAVRKRCATVGLREFARQVGVDPGNLSAVLANRRWPSDRMVSKLRSGLGHMQ
jgi:hypothetical protein